MHPAPAFHWQDRDAMRALVREVSFGALFAATPDGPRVAHVPAVFEGDDVLALHIGRGNGIARGLARGTTALFVVQGPDAYVSPDWYGLGPDQVPTWNYVAVELEGRLEPMDRAALRAHLDQLGQEQEARLAPKPAWRADKVDPALLERLLSGIHGYRLHLQAWRGTRKLGQTKPDAARHAAADALEALGRRAIAHWMRAL